MTVHGDSYEPALYPLDDETSAREIYRGELEHDPQAEPRLRDEWFGRGFGVRWGVGG